MVEVNVLLKLLRLYVNCVDGASMLGLNAEDFEHVLDDTYSDSYIDIYADGLEDSRHFDCFYLLLVGCLFFITWFCCLLSLSWYL